MAQAPPTKTWFDHLAAGRFMLQRVTATGEWLFYPRMAAPGTGDAGLEWHEASGLGTVHAVTVTRRKPPTPDESIVVVELDEGPRMMSRVEGIAPDSVRIGMRVAAKIVEGPDDRSIVVFEPVEVSS